MIRTLKDQLSERSKEVPRQQYTKAVHAEEAAAALGLVAFKRYPDVLMLDLDMPAASALSLVNDRLKALCPDATWDLTNPTAFLVTTSKSGNTHLYARIASAWSDVQAIAIQLFLGSDPAREALSLHTVNGWRWQSAPTILFETPEEAKRVQTWLVGGGDGK